MSIDNTAHPDQMWIREALKEYNVLSANTQEKAAKGDLIPLAAQLPNIRVLRLIVSLQSLSHFHYFCFLLRGYWLLHRFQ